MQNAVDIRIQMKNNWTRKHLVPMDSVGISAKSVYNRQGIENQNHFSPLLIKLNKQFQPNGVSIIRY